LHDIYYNKLIRRPIYVHVNEHVNNSRQLYFTTRPTIKYRIFLKIFLNNLNRFN